MRTRQFQHLPIFYPYPLQCPPLVTLSYMDLYSKELVYTFMYSNLMLFKSRRENLDLRHSETLSVVENGYCALG